MISPARLDGVQLDLFPEDGVATGATLSPCRRYRYVLWRCWDPALRPVMIIGLNPSTADETVNDRTIVRCIKFAKRWGYGSLYMLNLFAWRSTDPDQLAEAADPIGPNNNAFLLKYAAEAALIIAAWGERGPFLGRSEKVTKLLSGYSLYRLALTKEGQPRHPLYLHSEVVPVPYRGDEHLAGVPVPPFSTIGPKRITL